MAHERPFSYDVPAHYPRIMSKKVVNELNGKILPPEGFGKMPSMKFRLWEGGKIEWRHLEKGDYLGFDGYWRVVSAQERRETRHMGGRISERLRPLEDEQKN